MTEPTHLAMLVFHSLLTAFVLLYHWM